MNYNVKKWQQLWVLHLLKTSHNLQVESPLYDPHEKTPEMEPRIAKNGYSQLKKSPPRDALKIAPKTHFVSAMKQNLPTIKPYINPLISPMRTP